VSLYLERLQRLFLPARQRRFIFVFYALAVAMAAAGGGAVAGFVWRQARIIIFTFESEKILEISDAERLQSLLPALQARWAHLTQSALVRLQMAAVYLHAAERLPRQRPYFEAAKREAAEALALVGRGDAHLRLHAAAMLANACLAAGREHEAHRALTACEGILSALPSHQRGRWTMMHQNNLAYLHASASEPSLRNPPQALAQAEALLRQPIANGEEITSENAAFLDTLAEAYYANGNYRQALIVQRLALARAQGADLSIYLMHYDKYLAAATANMMPQNNGSVNGNCMQHP